MTQHLGALRAAETRAPETAGSGGPSGGDLPVRVDVAVVGAGLAGLKAAQALEKRGLSVCVLEARDRVGGRLKPGTIAGHVIDRGGQWVGPQQKLLLAEAKALKVETYPQYAKGRSILHYKGQRRQSSGDIPRMPLVALLELQRLVTRLDRMAASLPADACWQAARAQDWDSQTVESWIRANVWTQAAADFLRLVVRSVFCCEPKHLSLLYFLDYVRGGHGIDVLTGVRGGAQEAKFRGGAHQIAVRLAATLRGPLVYDAPVRAITQHDGHVDVITPKGTLVAGRVIIAIPPALAARIDFARALPTRRDHLMQRLPMGTVIKVHLAYERPFWREKGLSGMAVSDSLACNVLFDQSPEDLSCGILVGFFDADEAVAYSGRGDNARRAAAIESAVAYFGEEARHPIDYVDNDWLAEEWSRGCYVAHAAPGVMTSFGAALREPCGLIHWAGTETATEWAGYMDGALQSGLRAAGEIPG